MRHLFCSCPLQTESSQSPNTHPSRKKKRKKHGRARSERSAEFPRIIKCKQLTSSPVTIDVSITGCDAPFPAQSPFSFSICSGLSELPPASAAWSSDNFVLFFSRRARRLFTSFWYCSTVRVVLTLAVFLTFFARSAKRSVERVSKASFESRAAHNKNRFGVPPRASLRSHVSTLSRNGMCDRFRSVNAHNAITERRE